MSSRTPHLLEPYLPPPPEHSLTLLTGVLGASTNWLVLRYLHSVLSRRPGDRDPDREADEGEEGDTAAVFVSFMRDFRFWRDGSSKLGIDLEGLGRSGRFVFVDGLMGLFLADVPPRQKGRRTLSSAKLGDVQTEIEGAIADVRGEGRRVILILDQLDAFLATTSEETTSLSMGDMVLSLREGPYSTIMTLMADEPLIEAQTTTLEKSHAAFTLSMAHEAELVLGLRRLDTGTAKDVSGVVRITRGGAESESEIEAHEYLYFVGTDGGVRVFERGQ